jgi:cob(I)alamin adenosyltransferase
MGITTKNGDDGTTEILFGERVSKSDLRIEALGTLDEVSSFLGLAKSMTADDQTRQILDSVQRRLFKLGAEVALPKGKRLDAKARIGDEDIRRLEKIQAPIEEALSLPPEFAVAGANPASAALDVARSMTRRLERVLVRLSEAGDLDTRWGLVFVNRLADLLFILARREERA